MVIDLNIHLESYGLGKRDDITARLYGNKLDDLHPELADKLVLFEYPLNKEIELDPSFSQVPTLGNFIDFVVKSYQDIYTNDPENVWGHGLGDLFLEGINVRKDGKIDLLMGS